MIPFGKILKFGFYDAQQLERVKKDLALSVSIPFLQYCADYYKNQARRDPYIEELKMLERLSLVLQNAPQLVSVRELYTNDLVVAETYRDMMQKRKELMGDIASPITMGELSTLATNALLRVGKKQSHPFPLTLMEDGTPLRILGSRDSSPKSNDAFLLLSKSEQAEETSELDILLESKDFSSKIESLQKIKNGGILLALLRECKAFQINLDSLCDQESALFASLLTEAFVGDYLIRIPCDSQEAIIVSAQEQGFSPKVIAHADAGGSMTVLYGQKEFFSLDTAFLKTLFSQRNVKAKLQNEKDGTLISHAIRSDSSSCLQFEDFCCNQTLCDPKDAFFTNAFYSALLAVIRQCLCGSDYADQQLSVGLRIPAFLDEKTSGAVISTIVGLYRLQAELGVLSSTPSMVTDSQIKSPMLSVCACGKGKPLPTHLQSKASYAYLLKIEATETGLPDFDGLRKLLRELCQKRRNGFLHSAYTVCGEAPEEALRFLSRGNFVCALEENAFDVLPNAPISIIVESAIPIENAHYIGTVIEKEEIL